MRSVDVKVAMSDRVVDVLQNAIRLRSGTNLELPEASYIFGALHEAGCSTLSELHSRGLSYNNISHLMNFGLLVPYEKSVGKIEFQRIKRFEGVNNLKFSDFWFADDMKFLVLGVPIVSGHHAMRSPILGAANVIECLTHSSLTRTKVLGSLPASLPAVDLVYDLHRVALLCRIFSLIPLFVGGSHLLTYAWIRAASIAGPSTFDIVHIDAHHDLYGAGTAELNHANFLGKLAVDGLISTLTQIGLRDKTTPSSDYMGLLEGRRFVADSAADIMLEKLRRIHLSIDIDVLDPSVAPDVTHPLPSGWSYEDFEQNMANILERFDFISIDICEVCNGFEMPSVTAGYAAKMIKFIDERYIVRL